MAEQSIGTARIDIVTNAATMAPGVAAAKRSLSGLGADAAAQFEAANAAQKNLAIGLTKQINLTGQSRLEQIAYNAQLKVGGQLGKELAAAAIAKQTEMVAASVASAAAALEEKNAAQAAAQAESLAAETAYQQERAAVQARYDALRAAEEVSADEEMTASAVAHAAAQTEAAGVSATAFNAAVLEKQAALVRLNATMAGNLASTAGMAEAETALDEAMAVGALSASEQSAYFVKLAAAETLATEATVANTEATLVNGAALKLNSRAYTEIGVLAGELASGNTSRLKFTLAALANQTGFLRIAVGALLGPLGAVAVAVVALGVAWYQGGEEAAGYAKAIAATGDSAGVTAEQLGAMARSISSATGETIHYAAQVEAAVVSAGKFSSDQISLVSETALRASSVTGQSIATTIAQFKKLGEDPVKELGVLNDAQHFLTLTTYEQVKALQDQGDAQAAAALAEKTYAASFATRTETIKENLGTLQRAAHATGQFFKGMWDHILNVGRKASLGDQVQALNDKIAALGIGMMTPDGNYKPGAGEDDPRIKALRKQINDIYTGLEAANKTASDNALQAKITQDKISSDKEVAQYATHAQKRTAAILKIQGEYKQRIADAEAAGNGTLAGQLASDESKVIAGVEAKFKDAKKVVDPAVRALKAFQAQVDAITRKSIVPSGGDPALTKYEQAVAKLADELNKTVAAHGNATKAAALFVQGQSALAAQLTADQQKETAAAVAYKAALDGQLVAKQRQIDLQVASVGMGAKEIKQQQQLDAIYAKSAATIEQLQRQMAQRGANAPLIQAQIEDQKAQTSALVAQQTAAYAAMDGAQANWVLGVKAAYADITDNAANAAGMAKSLFTNAFDGLTSALTTFVTTGKLNFQSLIDSFISGLIQMELKIAESQALTSMFGGAGGSGWGGATGSGSGSYLSSFGSAIAGIFGGGKASGGSVDAGSLYQVNENGPELLTTNGSTYLMMGGQGGHVAPNTGGGSSSGGGAAPVVNVNIVGAPSQPSVTTSRGSNGSIDITATFEKMLANSMTNRGHGAQAMEHVYGLGRGGQSFG